MEGSFEIDLFVEGGACALACRWRERGGVRTAVLGAQGSALAQRLARHLRDSRGVRRLDHLVVMRDGVGDWVGARQLLGQLPAESVWLPPGLPGRSDARVLRVARQRLERQVVARGAALRTIQPGNPIGPFTVLSASQWAAEQAGAGARTRRTRPTGLRLRASRLHRGTLAWIACLFRLECLPPAWWVGDQDEGSTVLHAVMADGGLLLAPHAGRGALLAASRQAQALGIDLPGGLRTLLLPVQDAVDRVDSRVLDALLGPRGGLHRPGRRAVVCTSGRAPGAFLPLVIALHARGTSTLLMQGSHLHLGHGVPPRLWSPHWMDEDDGPPERP